MLENVLPDCEERIRKEKTNEIAKNLLNIWLAIEQIMQATELSQQDVLSLKNQNANALSNINIKGVSQKAPLFF